LTANVSPKNGIAENFVTSAKPTDIPKKIEFSSVDSSLQRNQAVNARRNIAVMGMSVVAKEE
jgi:hypothetical protein